MSDWFFCNPMDHSPPSSSVHGILQARILGWIAIFSSKGSSQSRVWTQVSCNFCRWIVYHSGQRSLAGHSPWGRKELDTERLTHRTIQLCILLFHTSWIFTISKSQSYECFDNQEYITLTQSGRKKHNFAFLGDKNFEDKKWQ